MSNDATTTLFVIAMEPHPDIEDLRVVAGDLRRVTEHAQGHGHDGPILGRSFLRLEIVSSLMADQMTFITAGFLIILLISWLFFHRATYVCIAAFPAVIAVIWLGGITGLRGTEVDVMSGVVPALVLVLVVASSLHLLFKVRRELGQGADVHEAIYRSVREIGPACVLASLTTAIALFSLTLVPLKIVAGFGLTAAIGTAIAYPRHHHRRAVAGVFDTRRVRSKGRLDGNIDFAFGAATRVCQRLGHFTLAGPAPSLRAVSLSGSSSSCLYS